MPSPFPGMDPYLETPDLWRDVHQQLISCIQEALNRGLRPNYVARIKVRLYRFKDNDPGLSAVFPGADVPIRFDEEMEEAFLEISHAKSRTLVTVLEVVSPTNKVCGSEGRESFMKKRHEILGSDLHWVEIDLLRSGEPATRSPRTVASDYRVFVSKAENHRRASFWPISMREALPVIGIPLLAADPDVPLDLGAVLATAYDRAAYDLSIDYTAPPEPPLAKDDAKWADKLLRAKGLR